MQFVTLTTDFGLRDHFVGVMKGVLLARAPRATVVDLTHDVAPGDIRTAAFQLMAAWRFFPRGTVHVAVVDPGVGTARRPLALASGGHLFVGPDNGVLTWAAPHPRAAVVLANPRYRLAPVSRTFHGRDIFAPAAAALATGVRLARLGPSAGRLVRLALPPPVAGPGGMRGEVLAIDRFGNAVTNLRERDARGRWGRASLAARAGKRRVPVVEAYGAVGSGRTLGIFGSAGFLELSVRDGRADRALRLRPGTPITLSPR